MDRPELEKLLSQLIADRDANRPGTRLPYPEFAWIIGVGQHPTIEQDVLDAAELCNRLCPERTVSLLNLLEPGQEIRPKLSEAVVTVRTLLMLVDCKKPPGRPKSSSIARRRERVWELSDLKFTQGQIVDELKSDYPEIDIPTVKSDRKARKLGK